MLIPLPGGHLLLRSPPFMLSLRRVIFTPEQKRYRAPLPSVLLLRVSHFCRPNGIIFTADQPEEPLDKGDIVSFAYRTISIYGIPVDPEILRVREDLSWEHVVMSSSLESPDHTLISKLIEGQKEMKREARATERGHVYCY